MANLAAGGFSTAGMRGSEGFPSPFMDVASTQMPEGNTNLLEWCEFIVQSNGTYRMAMERIISYFLTEAEIGAPSTEPVGDDEKDKWKTYLNDTLDVIQIIQSITRDRMCYGNGFASLIVPFKRFLYCPKCRGQYSLRTVHDEKVFKFRWVDFRFHATCPKCGFNGAWGVRDEPAKDESKLKVKRWSPHEIEIIHDPYTDDCAYIWKISEEYRKDIRDGEIYRLERASLEVIEAVKHNHVFLFAQDVIYHMKEPTLAGVKNRGWGISRVMTNFRQVWYVQVLHRYNEAIALDYVIPFRLLTPMPRGGASSSGGQVIDPLVMTNMGDFSSQVNRMLRKRRRDPASWHTLPFPVQYQALGGDATQLAPRDLLDQGLETLLNNIGTPVEMYRGTLTLQAAPVALRLFEATWHHLVHDINGFLRWLVDQISQILSWESVTAKLRSVNHVDDINKQMAILQLMMGQSISQTTGLKGLDINWREEQRGIAEEARYQAQMQAEVQEEMEQAAYGQQIAKGQAPGAAPPGGAAPGGAAPAGPVDPMTGQPAPQPVSNYVQSMGPNTPVTPQDLMTQADSLAQQLLGLPESQKDSELRLLKQKNEVLHSIVTQRLKSIRQKAQTAGGSMLMSQQGMGGPPAA